MKTILSLIFAGCISTALGQVDTARNIVHSTVQGTKNAAQTVAHGVKNAADKVEDAFTPDPDATRVDVSVTDDKVDMPTSLKPGKTAFVIKNSSSTTQNFEVAGHGVDREFKNAPKPGETKVLTVTLKRGTYSVYSPDTNGEKGTAKTTFKVH